MLGWLKREAAVMREAVKSGQRIDDVRRYRDTAAADAEALGASISDVRRVAWREAGTMSMQTKYGPLHLRPTNSDWLVIRQVFIDGEYDFEKLEQMTRIRAAYAAMLAAGDTPVIIDAGANIGAASIYFHSLFPLAKIVAIEPDPDNVAIARLNLTGVENVELREAAIGGSAGVVHIAGPKEGGWGAQTVRAETGILVETVNGLVAEVPRGKLLLAKIDIEGFEGDLFETNTEWTREAVAVIIEPHDWLFPGKGTSQSLQRAMVGQGRELLISGENLVFV